MKTSMEMTETKSWTGLADRVLEILRCLTCKGTLLQRETGLVCAECGRQYPVVKGVVRFVDTQHYAGSFGFQWLTFRDTQLDTETSRRSEADFRRRTGYSNRP